MKVSELMTTDVITVTTETALKEAAGQLAANRISGLPVIDPEGRVVGVLSEADILEKEAGGRGRQSVLERLLAGERPGKLEARTVGEAMSSPPITASPRDEAAHAARLMVERKINRLPVVDDERRLAGIVTRADLVRAFARPDDEIERELRDEVVFRTLWIDPATVEISVQNGEVTLAGELDTQADARLLESFAARVPGVVGIESHLRWRRDEARLPRPDPHVPIPPTR